MRGEPWPREKRVRYCFDHCRENLQKRYHLGLTWQEYHRLCRELERGYRNPIAHSWGGREVLVIWHGGRPTKAIYCPSEGLLITFLPPYAYELHGDDRDWRRQVKREKERRVNRIKRNCRKVKGRKRQGWMQTFEGSYEEE